MDELRIGVLGLGTVGTGVVRLLQRHEELLQQRTGLTLRLVRIATRHPKRERDLDLTALEVTDDISRVVGAADIDVVVELIGGVDPAMQYVTTALEKGQHVVTANKALLAKHGNTLLGLASKVDRELAFEASVAGAVPIIKALRESLSANRIQQIFGILNGTCNYILTEMRERELPFQEVLADAQAKGYAEADPAFDVEGIDAAHKLAIIAAIAFGTPISFSDISVEGICDISELDIAWATEMDYRIKLLAIAKQGDAGIELRVHPTLIPANSMIAAVEGVFNAVSVKGDFSGPTLFYGRGAGEKPTASAVVADLVDIARNRRSGTNRRIPGLSCLRDHLNQQPIRPLADLQGEYYLRLAVVDQPGVLAEITAILSRHHISIDAIHQKGRSRIEAVPLVLVTHKTSEKQIQSSLMEIEKLEFVKEKPHLIRIETLLDAAGE